MIRGITDIVYLQIEDASPGRKETPSLSGKAYEKAKTLLFHTAEDPSVL
jgi:hypothetical protein